MHFDFPIKVISIQGTTCSICLKLQKSPIDFDYLQFYQDRVPIFGTGKDQRIINPSKPLKTEDCCIFLILTIFCFSVLLYCKSSFPRLLSSAVPALVFQACILIHECDLLSRFLWISSNFNRSEFECSVMLASYMVRLYFLC